MAFFIQRQSTIDSDITVYYCGDNRWSDNSSEKKLFSTKTKAVSESQNNDGKNGGFSHSTIVSE